jgi:ribosomal RNA-processing protein 8
MAKRKQLEATEKGEKKQRPQKKDDSKNKTEKKDEPGDDAPWSKSKKKRMRLLKGKSGVNNDKGSTEKPKADTEKASKKSKKKKEEIEASLGRYDKGKQADESKSPTSSLQQSFKARLMGSRFRILNEELYTTTSSTALERFSSNPELYEQYHEGFRHQVEQWPINPVTTIVNRLKSRIGNDDDGNKIVVADFGCGDAELAKQLLQQKHKGKCPFKIHSFDLVAASDLVTACDMSNVPLPKGSVDVGIFCLSLMGTNMADFIREAHRVLKDNGRLHIAEVRSRFESKAGKESGKDGKAGKESGKDSKSGKDKSGKESGKDDLEGFVSVLDELGFKVAKTDRSNKMFVLMDLKKSGKAPKKDVEFTAKPCIYKRR